MTAPDTSPSQNWLLTAESLEAAGVADVLTGSTFGLDDELRCARLFTATGPDGAHQILQMLAKITTRDNERG